MQDSSLLLRRIERLERRNQRLTRAFGALTTALVAALTLSWALPDARQSEGRIEGRELVLTDEGGETYASIEIDSQGLPLMVLKKDGAHVAFTLSGPAVHLRAPDGKRSAFLGIDARGETRLELTGEAVQGGLRGAVHRDGSSGLYLLGDDGFDRATMETHPEGDSVFTLRGDNAGVRGSFGLDRQGNVSTILNDVVGRRRLGSIVLSDGTPSFSMEDERGRLRANWSMLFDGTPSLQMLREDGQASFEAP